MLALDAGIIRIAVRRNHLTRLLDIEDVGKAEVFPDLVVFVV